MEKSPHFELERYVAYMTNDLEQQALQLHRRDVENFQQHASQQSVYPVNVPGTGTTFSAHKATSIFSTKPSWMPPPIRAFSSKTSVPAFPHFLYPPSFTLGGPSVLPTTTVTTAPNLPSEQEDVKVEELSDIMTASSSP